MEKIAPFKPISHIYDSLVRFYNIKSYENMNETQTFLKTESFIFILKPFHLWVKITESQIRKTPDHLNINQNDSLSGTKNSLNQSCWMLWKKLRSILWANYKRFHFFSPTLVDLRFAFSHINLILEPNCHFSLKVKIKESTMNQKIHSRLVHRMGSSELASLNLWIYLTALP